VSVVADVAALVKQLRMIADFNAVPAIFGIIKSLDDILTAIRYRGYLNNRDTYFVQFGSQVG
jgi:hypothetical protein